MAGKRLVAVLAAVLLIVGAVVLRRVMDDDDPSNGPDEPARVACSSDLRAVCEQLDVDGVAVAIEPWSTTVAAVAAGEGPDAWITLAPVHRLAAGPGGEVAFGEAVPLGSAPLAMAVRAERAETLASACDGATTWRCVGDNAGRPWEELGGQETWGNLAPGVDDPTSSATGLLTLGAAAASYFGRSDFNSVDIDADDEFLGWYTRLVRAIPSFVLDAESALDALATGRAIDLAGTSDAGLAELGAAPSSRFTVTYPEPMARADAVLVVAGDGDVPSALANDANTGFTETAGWQPTPDTPNGIPSAGALQTLLDLWDSIR